MKVIIVTDGNNHLGLGHIYQSVTLARLLTERSASVHFLTKSDTSVCKLIHDAGFEAKQFDNDDEIFDSLKQENPDRILFDKLDVSPVIANRIKTELHKKLIIFTNLTEANLVADMTVLADIGSNFQNIVNRTDIGQVQFYGPKYWLLRPEFYELKKKSKVPASSIKSVMLMFGGADPANMSTFVLDEILKMNQSFEILLVLGSSFKHNDELQEILNRHKNSKSQLRIARNLKNVGEEMFNHDVVFASPGLSFFEALAVGTPVVGFHQDELQKEVYADVLPTLGREDLGKVPYILINKTFIYPHDLKILKMEIGEGKDELLNEILR
jgi:spore coat polysaccharide biosynthesis predicted glycosyltransferase SpsG